MSRIFSSQALLQVGDYVGVFYTGFNVWIKSDKLQKLLDAIEYGEIPDNDKDFIVIINDPIVEPRDWLTDTSCPKSETWYSPNYTKLMLNSIKIIVCLFFCIQAKTQSFSPVVSSGVLYSNYRTLDFGWKGMNPCRRGKWISLNQNIKLYKWINLDAGLSYQERIPLEFLPFSTGTIDGVVGSQFILKGYPTNPQHKLFKSGDYTVPFPNFKYLYLEAIPNITFGNKWSVMIGEGIFGGILLNKKETTITHNELPDVEEALATYNAEPAIKYQKNDYGFVSKVAFGFKPTSKIKLGLLFKIYQSYAILNETLVDKHRKHNMRWIVFMGGLSFEYNFGNENQQ